MLELIMVVELGVAGCSIDSHFIDDLKPAVSKTSQGVGVALVLLAMMLIVQLGPHATGQTLLGEKMHGMAEVFVTSSAGENMPVFSSFAGTLGDRCASGQALKVLRIAVEALAIKANFGQQARCELGSGTGQRTKQMVIGVTSEEFFDSQTINL